MHLPDRLHGAVSQKLEAGPKQAMPESAFSSPLPDHVPAARMSSLQSSGTPYRLSSLSKSATLMKKYLKHTMMLHLLSLPEGKCMSWVLSKDNSKPLQAAQLMSNKRVT